ncbi:MAG: energy transducer TonB [Bacteroidetes bacterium]|nr:energy transducer TonB [Bacteroidota bacterium]MBS1931262.1 energy transducer TonB [Bacteroidota bacterium]
MTSKEILQASLLDIMFDNRNKDYGAYTLRRNYNQRLLGAVCSALAAVVILFILVSIDKKDQVARHNISERDSVMIRKIELPDDKPRQPIQPKAMAKSLPRIATITNISKLVITDDSKVKETTIPDIKELGNSQISNITSPGIPFDGAQKIIDTKETGIGNSGTQNAESDFKPVEQQPEFPGGQQSLIRFLKRNLNIPGDLQAGESKTVYIRFLVGTDGLVSDLEIVQTGGSEFDQEVIRVCKKMPRWIPAFQNGSNVAIMFKLPITFIGFEQ